MQNSTHTLDFFYIELILVNFSKRGKKKTNKLKGYTVAPVHVC